MVQHQREHVCTSGSEHLQLSLAKCVQEEPPRETIWPGVGVLGCRCAVKRKYRNMPPRARSFCELFFFLTHRKHALAQNEVNANTGKLTSWVWMIDLLVYLGFLSSVMCEQHT